MLGNLDAKRDWGFAGDYVEAMWLMLQQDEPDDFVVATGEEHSVREFVELAFARVGLDPDDHVRRRSAVPAPGGGRPPRRRRLARRATKLGWEPRASFRELVEMMVDADLARLSAAGRPVAEPSES